MNAKLSKAQKLGNPVNPAFTFWRENRKDQEFQFFASDLKQLFQKWLTTKEQSWLQYYGSDQSIRCFLTSKDGVNSVFDEKEFPEIYRLLKPDYMQAI